MLTILSPPRKSFPGGSSAAEEFGRVGFSESSVNADNMRTPSRGTNRISVGAEPGLSVLTIVWKELEGPGRSITSLTP